MSSGSPIPAGAVSLGACLAAGLATLLPVCAAFAQSPFDERFSLTVGAFRASLDTEIRVDARDGLGSLLGDTIRLERDLDLDGRQVIARADGWLRLGGNHRIGFSVLDLNRSARAELDRALRVGDVLFEANARVRAEFDAQAIDLLYRYSLVRNTRSEFDLMAGVHAMRLSVRLTELDGAARQSARGAGPLPMLGLGLNQALGANLFLTAEGKWLRGRYGSLDGRVVDARAGLDWRPARNVSLGAHYNYFKLASDIDRSLWDGRVELAYRGPQLSLGLRF